jgi:hypothetical protein
VGQKSLPLNRRRPWMSGQRTCAKTLVVGLHD